MLYNALHRGERYWIVHKISSYIKTAESSWECRLDPGCAEGGYRISEGHRSTSMGWTGQCRAKAWGGSWGTGNAPRNLYILLSLSLSPTSPPSPFLSTLSPLHWHSPHCALHRLSPQYEHYPFILASQTQVSPFMHVHTHWVS